MNYELTGRVHHIGQSETHGNYTKRVVVIDDQADKYPQQVAIEYGGKALESVDRIKVGDIVTATFNIRGREWNGRWFVNLSGWKIALAAAKAEPVPATADEPTEMPF